MLFRSIQALGGGGLARAGMTRALTARLNNVAKAAANTPAVKTLMRGLLAGGRYAAGAADEAVEEWLQAVLDPVVRNHILGEDNEVKLFGEEQLYAAMLGAMGAAVMNAPNIGANYRSADATVQQALDDAVRKATPAAPVESPAASPAESPAESPVSPAPASEQQIDAVAIRDLTAEISRLETVLLTAKPRHRAAVQRALAARQTQLQQLLLGQNVTPQTQGNEPAASKEDLQDLTPADDIEATRTEAENQIRDEIEAAIENLSQPEEEAAPAALPEVSTPAVEADLQAQINQEVQTILEAASRGEIDTNEAVDAIVDLVNANREGLENGGHAYSIPGRQSENGVRGRMEPLYGLSETGRTVQNYEEGGAAAAEERGQLYREGIDNAEGLQRFAHTDGAPEWGSRNDDGRRGSSLQEMAGQVLRGEGGSTDTTKRREYIAGIKGRENIDIPPSIISSKGSGHIKVLPDDFMDGINRSAPEWLPIVKAYEEAQNKGVASNLVFYSDESYNPLSEKSQKETALGCYYPKTNTMWEIGRAHV